MMLKSLLLPVLFLHLFASAQYDHPAGLAYAKTTAYSNRFRDAFSYSGNVGALGSKQAFSAGIYSERRFLLKDLASYSAAIVLPTSSGNFGVRGDYHGGQLFNQSMLGLAYARQLGNTMRFGLQFNYHSLHASGYGAASALGIDAGAILQLSPQLNAGVQVYNPVGTSWGKENKDQLPAVYAVGLGYDASTQVFIGAEAEKTEDQPVSVNAGLQYVVAEKLITRAGIRSANAVYYFGFGVRLKQIRLDATASMHPYLGITPGLLLLFSPNQ